MSIYHQFLQIKRNNSEYLPSDLEELLSVVHDYNQQAKSQDEECIRCTELLAITYLGSPATVHKNYRKLVKKGFLRNDASGGDKRVKYITLTPLGLNYFKAIDRILLEMLKENQKKFKKVLTV